jgi:hypothetical protein
MKNKNLTFALLILLTATLGCRLMMNQLKTDFFKADRAQKAANAVKDKVGFKFKVQEVEITENTFKMKIENPGNPQNIDEYTYLGCFVSDAKPVQLNGNTRTLDKLPFDEIDFSVVPQIIKNALEKTQIEGGKVTKLTFMTYVGNKFGWDVDIQGTRETASARANLKGEIVSVNLSQTNRAANYKILDEAELKKAADAIKAKFGENARFEQIAIREGKIDLKVLISESATKTDLYSFGISGWIKSPLPPMPANPIFEPFQLVSINLTDAVVLASKAEQRLDLPNGQINFISIEQRRAFTKADENPQLIWTVSVNQGANGGSVSYDAKLTEISVRKN